MTALSTILVVYDLAVAARGSIPSRGGCRRTSSRDDADGDERSRRRKRRVLQRISASDPPRLRELLTSAFGRRTPAPVFTRHGNDGPRGGGTRRRPRRFADHGGPDRARPDRARGDGRLLVACLLESRGERGEKGEGRTRRLTVRPRGPPPRDGRRTDRRYPPRGGVVLTDGMRRLSAGERWRVTGGGSPRPDSAEPPFEQRPLAFSLGERDRTLDPVEDAEHE